MKNKLWEFVDEQGTFVSTTANKVSALYFPLCNTHPIMSSVSPDLHGDLKTDYNSYLLEPVSRLDLSNLKSSRNFWIYINPKKIWSACGASKDAEQINEDKFHLEAGLLWHKVTRRNKKVGLEAQITSFIPSSGDPIEIMRVEIVNISARPIKFTPTCAIPVYSRSCNNLHDHRHVTSLLQRLTKERFGIMVRPTLVFNEAGHDKNPKNYFVFGINTDKQDAPQYIYATYEEFCGEDADLERPDAIFKNQPPAKNKNYQGKEVIAGLRFKPGILKPKQSLSYIIAMGITKDKAAAGAIWEKFNSKAKVETALQETKLFWQKKSSEITTDTKDKIFDNWFKWVNTQPTFRNIFGCGFLPDFDYGKGGRGWRDLWQDCLSLILNNPKEVREILVNNFSGVRSDGSNATIIGTKPGEFIADRNNISRVWMDHGVWPLLTAHLYIHQTADLNILLEETTYFRDHQLCRSKERDLSWTPGQGKLLKDKNGEVYKGTLLEHLLLENLVQFFNVGEHNHIRLEDADWNDGLDMAPQFGESVAFSAMYAQNLNTLAEIISRLDSPNLSLFKELSLLLDSLNEEKIDYADISAKQKLLARYFETTKYSLSGEKISLSKEKLIADLKKKSEWMYANIRNNEWLKEGFFNGYYNEDKQRVEGNLNGLTRMTLTGQTFPIMSGAATTEQIKETFKNAQKYLKNKELGGFHLNTDFKEEQHNLGRAFSFVYGDKENGAFFSHMSIMFAYALYKQGFAKEGYEVIDSIYKMAQDTPKSKIYPCLPEYFNAEGRGLYSYLTGSASWFVLTLLTQVFGLRGEYGDLVIAPKLIAKQFKKDTLSITTRFADKPIEVKFINPRKKDFGSYAISKVTLNREVLPQNEKCRSFTISRSKFSSLSETNTSVIEVTLD